MSQHQPLPPHVNAHMCTSTHTHTQTHKHRVRAHRSRSSHTRCKAAASGLAGQTGWGWRWRGLDKLVGLRLFLPFNPSVPSWLVMLSVPDRFVMVQITSRSLAAFHVLALQASELSESPGLASSTVLFLPSPCMCPWVAGADSATPPTLHLAGEVEDELLHAYSRVYTFDTPLIMVRVAVLVAVTLTVPIVLFPVSTLSPEGWVCGSDSLWIWVSVCLPWWVPANY